MSVFSCDKKRKRSPKWFLMRHYFRTASCSNFGGSNSIHEKKKKKKKKSPKGILLWHYLRIAPYSNYCGSQTQTLSMFADWNKVRIIVINVWGCKKMFSFRESWGALLYFASLRIKYYKFIINMKFSGSVLMLLLSVVPYLATVTADINFK